MTYEGEYLVAGRDRVRQLLAVYGCPDGLQSGYGEALVPVPGIGASAEVSEECG